MGSVPKSVPRGQPAVEITPNRNTYPGYTLTEIQFGAQTAQTTLQAIITPEESVIRVYYTKDETKVLPYEVITWVGEEKTIENLSTWEGSPWVTISREPQGIAGYALESITFGEQTHPNLLTAKITATAHQFVLRYAPKAPEVWSYRIYHHVGDEVKDTEQGSVFSDASSLLVQPEEYAGYIFDKISFYDQNFTEASVVEITPTQYEVHIYYREQAPFLYTIQHIDEAGKVFEESTDYASPQNPVVQVAPVSPYRGHWQEKIVFEGREAASYMEATLSTQNQLIQIYYRKDSTLKLNYTNKYYYNQVEESYLRQVWAGDDLLIKPALLEKEGYSFVRMDPALPLRVNEGDVISYYYESDNSGEPVFLPYTIAYYQDGLLLPEETVQGKTQNPLVTLTPLPNKFSGYDLRAVRFGGREEQYSISGYITEQENRFEVYYTSQPQTKLSYQVVYYYDSVLDPTKTEHLTVDASNPQVTKVPLKPVDGYLPAEQFTLPVLPSYLAEGDTIAVYYQLEKMPVESEPPKEPPVEPQEDIPLAVEVKLFGEYGELIQSQTETVPIPQGVSLVLGERLARKRTVNSKEYQLDSIYILETEKPSKQGGAPQETPVLGWSGLSPTLGQSAVSLGLSQHSNNEQGDRSPVANFRLLRLTEERVLGPYDSFLFQQSKGYEVLAHYTQILDTSGVEAGVANNTPAGDTATAKEKPERKDNGSTFAVKAAKKPDPVAAAPPPEVAKAKQKDTATLSALSQLEALPKTGKRRGGMVGGSLGLLLLLSGWIALLRKKD